MSDHYESVQVADSLGENISREEWRWLSIWSAVIVVVTCLPVIFAWLQTPDDWFYTGTLISPSDSNTYLAKMKQGFDGHWLFSIAYTSEPHQPTFLHPYYLFLGHFARLTNLSLGVTFQLFRVLNSYVLLLAIYFFCSHFWQEPKKRRVVFLYTVFASGLGWFLVFFGIPTSDINIPESVIFLTIMGNPHFPLSTAMILLNLMWGMKTLKMGSWKYAALLGLGQLTLLYLHPYDIMITGGVLGVYYLIGWLVYQKWSWKMIGHLSLGWLICSPGLVHNLRLFTQGGVWKLWQTQSPPPMPPFKVFAFGYGILLILGIIGLFVTYVLGHKRKQIDFLVTTIWALLVFMLMFTPIPFLKSIQVRFSEGLQIPVTFLAVEALFHFERKSRGRRVLKSNRWIMLLFVLSLSNLLLFTGTFWRVKALEPPWFYKVDDIEVMRWLDENSTENDVVMSLEWSGNHIPTQANVHVYVGHLYETIDYWDKVEKAENFYHERMSKKEELCFLVRHGIDWVFIGNQELDTPFDPENKSFLVQSFSAGESSIYQVDIPESEFNCTSP